MEVAVGVLGLAQGALALPKLVQSVRAFGADLVGVTNSGWSLKSYTGDVYSPEFVGPVKWDYFYRGDSTLRSDFLSSMTESRGVQPTEGFLNSLSGGAHADILAEHGVSSVTSPYISTSKNPAVAEYFARGPGQNQNGFVTTFRVESREAAVLQDRGLIVPNYENPMSFFEPNPHLGLPESEFLFRNFIDQRYIFQQTPVH